MGVSKVTGVADSAPSCCGLFELRTDGIAPHLSCVVWLENVTNGVEIRAVMTIVRSFSKAILARILVSF
jgi:hypothetical protein